MTISRTIILLPHDYSFPDEVISKTGYLIKRPCQLFNLLLLVQRIRVKIALNVVIKASKLVQMKLIT